MSKATLTAAETYRRAIAKANDVYGTAMTVAGEAHFAALNQEYEDCSACVLVATISPELTAFLEELDAMRAITKTRKYPGSESHIAEAKAIDRARCARLALEAIRKTDYDEARAVFTAAKTTTVSSRQAYDVAVDAYSESRDAGTKTAAASMRKAYLLAIIAQETAYRAVCNARSVMVDNGTD